MSATEREKHVYRMGVALGQILAATSLLKQLAAIEMPEVVDAIEKLNDNALTLAETIRGKVSAQQGKGTPVE